MALFVLGRLGLRLPVVASIFCSRLVHASRHGISQSDLNEVWNVHDLQNGTMKQLSHHLVREHFEIFTSNKILPEAFFGHAHVS